LYHFSALIEFQRICPTTWICRRQGASADQSALSHSSFLIL
jgi:hypothetical protein